MYANLRCESCGFTQQVPMGPGPSMAACNSCGGAMQVPGAASAMPMYPEQRPQQYAQGPMPMQGYPRQGYYPYPPPRTSKKAGLIAGLAIAGFVVLMIVVSVVSAISAMEEIENNPHRFSSPGRGTVYGPTPKFRAWLMRTSSNGQFAIDMPGKPIESDRTLRNDQGRMKAHMLTLREDDAQWEVEYWDSEHDVADDAYSLGGEIDVLAEVHGCQPESEKEIKLKSLAGEEFAGREVRFAALDNDVYLYRIYGVRNRIYVICALTRPSVKDGDAERFMNSFRLIGNIPKDGWPASFLPEPSKEERGTAVPKPK